MTQMRRSRMLDRRMGRFWFNSEMVKDKFETVAQMFALYKLLPIDVQYDVVDDVYIYTVLGNVLLLLLEGDEPPVYRFSIENLSESDSYFGIPISFLTLRLLDGTILKRKWKEVEDVQDKR